MASRRRDSIRPALPSRASEPYARSSERVPRERRPVSCERPQPDEIRIGVSACLLGQEVRYDGGHKRDPFLTGTLAGLVRFIPVCPEVEAGLGVPRESMQLVRDGDAVRLVTTRTGIDHTASMRRFARQRVAALVREDLSGFVFKRNSPSCGLFEVRLHDRNGVPSSTGRGLFAAALIERLPDLPVEEEERLRDPTLRDSFLERVFAYRRLTQLLRGSFSIARLAEFHARERPLLRVRDPAAEHDLTSLVAEAAKLPRPRLKARYRQRFLEAFKPDDSHA